jgi:DNA (cytosine-5)-methyltransferase 1
LVGILDLYCGMGGLSLGLALALDGAEVLGLDVDGWAVETYNLNLSELGCRAEVWDVLKWEPEGDFDVVVGGSPCQPFSLANTKKRGEEHPLFPTFPRFFDLVLALRPKAFILENVKGLALKRFRHYLDAQLARVSGDYRVQMAVLDASRYGVPQRRERLFAVGIRRDLGARFKFPEPTHASQEHVALDGRKIHRWLTLREAIGDLMVLPPLRPDEPSVAVVSHSAKSSRHLLAPALAEHVMTELGGWATPRSDWGSRVMREGTPAFTIMETHRSGQLLPVVYRRLTVRECLRVQSFPDWWRFPEGCAVSRRYRLVGEAVPPILAYRLGVALAKALGLRAREPPREEDWALPYFRRAFADYF